VCIYSDRQAAAVGHHLGNNGEGCRRNDGLEPASPRISPRGTGSEWTPVSDEMGLGVGRTAPCEQEGGGLSPQLAKAGQTTAQGNGILAVFQSCCSGVGGLLWIG